MTSTMDKITLLRRPANRKVGHTLSYPPTNEAVDRLDALLAERPDRANVLGLRRS